VAVLTAIGAVGVAPEPAGAAATMAAVRPRMSEATGVNNAALVVGWSETWAGDESIGPAHAVVWSPTGSGYQPARDLGTLGGLVSRANAVNDLGEVVGWSHDAGGVVRAFLWSSATGQMTALGGLPGATACQARDINDRSQVVGACTVPSGSSIEERPVLWSGGQVIDLTAGLASGRAMGINDRGEVVGAYGPYLALWSGGERIDLGEIIYNIAAEINDRSEVVGNWSDINGHHGRLFTRGPEGTYQETDIGTLGGNGVVAHDINERGEVTGWSSTAVTTHGFVWDQGTMTDIGTLGGLTSHAYAINDRGEVVGQSNLPSQAIHAFIWYRGTMADLGIL
jgi:probable HAF family extracellular repeat protein